MQPHQGLMAVPAGHGWQFRPGALQTNAHSQYSAFTHHHDPSSDKMSAAMSNPLIVLYVLLSTLAFAMVWIFCCLTRLRMQETWEAYGPLIRQAEQRQLLRLQERRRQRQEALRVQGNH